ncbi:uncharacterized protein LOC127103457 [Lathyrus oleraceus]|uniref:uncharacterized protein LOC127103457 n=1 Tax=Pisum sativum TaxID=3888 RepID=UPI0021D09F12|nr:uncharacterized protein LOC127103457 [Pisum sativum]
MPVYDKFMKELLNGKRKFKDDENVALAEECSAIIQCKLKPKLTDPGTLCLGASINLMSLSMMRKLNCGEPKTTKMTLTLSGRSITYPYGVVEDVLVKVDNLLFPADFVNLDMPEDAEIPLLLGRPFLATRIALMDVEREGLILRFNK